MVMEAWIQYGFMAAALALLIWKWNGMKAYIPVGLFASFYANAACTVEMFFGFWTFPYSVWPVSLHLSAPFNLVVLPIIVMFWVRFMPLRLHEQIWWAFLWSVSLTSAEYLMERYTNLIAYHNGYDWYYTFPLWMISWFVWYGFHIWLHGGRSEVESFLKRSKIKIG